MATRIANVDDRGERSVWTLSATIKSMAQLIRADATVGFFVFLSIRSVLAMVISLSAAISPNTNTLKPKIQVSVYENVFTGNILRWATNTCIYSIGDLYCLCVPEEYSWREICVVRNIRSVVSIYDDVVTEHFSSRLCFRTLWNV